MSIKMILFDLDGTLLPMDMDEFIRNYFGRLSQKLAPLGYDPALLVKNIWKGTAAMIQNDGRCTNETAFWNTFAALYGEDVRKDEPVFAEYYQNEFQLAKEVCGFNPKVKETVDTLKAMGYRVALATNPIFPAIATESRIRWAGLEPKDFEFYTTYENASCSKPNPAYYQWVAKHLNCRPEECLMVGNDVDDDLPAETIGMKVFLLTDCLINKEDKDISAYPQGSFEELMEYIKIL